MSISAIQRESLIPNYTIPRIETRQEIACRSRVSHLLSAPFSDFTAQIYGHSTGQWCPLFRITRTTTGTQF